MGLFEGFRAGIDASRALNENVSEAAKARYAFPSQAAQLNYQQLVNKYYGPEHQAAIDYQTINNKYLPEKLRLGNVYQNKINNWYDPIADANVRSTNTMTNLAPYETAVKMEQALKANSRSSAANEWMINFARLNSKQQSVWMAQPGNLETYNRIQEAAAQGITGAGMAGNSPVSLNGQVLTPDVVRQFKEVSSVGNKGLASPIPASVTGNNPYQVGNFPNPQGAATPPQNNAPPVIVNNGQQPGQPQQPMSQAQAQPQFMPRMPPPMPQQGLSSPIPGMAPPFQMNDLMRGQSNAMTPMPQQASAISAIPPNATPGSIIEPANGKESAVAAPTVAQAKQAQEMGIDPQKAVEKAKESKNPDLSPAEKTALGFQAQANAAVAGTVVTNRANAAMVFHNFLYDNQEQIIPAIRNAAKLSGIYGQIKLNAGKPRGVKSEDYQDYLYVVNDLIPNMGFNIKAMDKLASSNQQMEQLNNTWKSSLSWASDPETAIKNLNRTFDMFGKEADSILKAAQPLYPGVLQKLNKTGPLQKNYLKEGQAKIELNGQTMWGDKKDLAAFLKDNPTAKVIS